MPEQPQEDSPQGLVRFGAQVLPPLGPGMVTSVVCGRVDERPVALVCEDDRSVRVWDMDGHRQLGRPITPRGHEPVWAVAYGVLEGRPVAVLAGGGIWTWDLRDRSQISRGGKIRSVGAGLRAVACTRIGGRLVAVTGGYENAVRIWDVRTGEQVGEPLRGHTSTIWSVACGVISSRPVALTASEDRTVRVWDLSSREQAGQPLCGHDDVVRTVAYGVLDGRPIAISASGDRTLRLWDLDDPDRVGMPLTDRTEEVEAAAFTTVRGRPVAVSGGHDTVRVWDLRTRRQTGPPLFDGRDPGLIRSVACGILHGRPVALAVVTHETVRVWDLEEHQRIGMNVSARYAAELPLRWTDPASGDVYDLSRPLVDEAGDRWEYVDFDGFEPIVAECPVDPHVTLGVSNAHFQFNFRGVVAAAPRRRQARVVHSVHREYYDFRAPEDQALTQDQITELAGRYPNAKVTPARMVIDFDPDDDTRRGRSQGKRGLQPPLMQSGKLGLLRTYFDACLDFQADGRRYLLIRVPTARLALAAVTPYLTESVHGLSARTEGTDLILGFSHYEEDGELTHWRERPDTWLKPLLPLRADLAAGDLSAAYIGWLKLGPPRLLWRPSFAG